MILNDNSTQQINTLVIQLQNKITNLTNEFRKLNNNINDLDSEISDLKKRVSSNENDADNNIGDLDSKINDLEKRVSSNENAAAAMNTEISANTEAISGKADKIHTHTKSEITDFPTSLPANGGTADSANNGFNSSTTTDSTPGWGYLTSANGYSNGRTYRFANGGGIATAEKDTKSSLQVDGDLYVHEGLDKVATLNDIPTSLPANGGTADSSKKLEPFVYWEYPFVYDETNGIRYFVFKIQMVPWFNSTLIQTYSDINYAKSRKYILGLWHNSSYGYNVSVTDLGGTMNDALRVWLGNDGNVYLQAMCEWISRISFSYIEDASDITVEKIGSSRLGSNTDIDGNVLFTPLTDPIIDCGAISASDLSSASKVKQYLKADEFIGSTGTFTEKITAPNITNLEQRIAALESKI